MPCMGRAWASKQIGRPGLKKNIKHAGLGLVERGQAGPGLGLDLIKILIQNQDY